MNAVGNTYKVRYEQGFEVYVLNNRQVEIAVVPELGSRIISLKDLRTAREWLWHPPGERKLFRNRPGDDFGGSPLVGMDECFPTIAPCAWQGRNLPDHGEVWALAWAVDNEAWQDGLLRTSAELTISPFDLERTIELQENEVHLNYRLKNRGATPELYLWSMHPLLRLQPGDQLELPASTRALLDGAAWIDALDSGNPKGDCEKVFACPVTEGLGGIINSKTADRLIFEWDPTQNDTLGLWLTRGGWNGLHHFALEPANGSSDALSTAAQSKSCGTLAGHESIAWHVCLRVGRDMPSRS